MSQTVYEHTMYFVANIEPKITKILSDFEPTMTEILSDLENGLENSVQRAPKDVEIKLTVVIMFVEKVLHRDLPKLLSDKSLTQPDIASWLIGKWGSLLDKFSGPANSAIMAHPMARIVLYVLIAVKEILHMSRMDSFYTRANMHHFIEYGRLLVFFHAETTYGRAILAHVELVDKIAEHLASESEIENFVEVMMHRVEKINDSL